MPRSTVSEVPVVVVREPGRTPLFLLLREPLEVGRDGAGLLLDDPGVSRRHLVLRPEGGSVTVLDLGGTNGTVLDGEPVEGAVSLAPGSVLRIGHTTIERVAVSTSTNLLAPFEFEAPAPTSIERVAAQVTTERPPPPTTAHGEGTVTIVFTDIESSTELAFRLGDERWLSILHRHNEIVRESLQEHRGNEVKGQGDGFMLTFGSARGAVLFMMSAQRRLTKASLTADGSEIRMRAGGHTGEAMLDVDGDLFGHHVNLAARVAGQAAGGEILVSSIVREIVEPRGDIRFGEPRTTELKGLAGTYRLHPVLWEPPAAELTTGQCTNREGDRRRPRRIPP